MCLGKAPSCGVHSLLIPHAQPAVSVSIAGFQWGYAKGCHACQALVEECGGLEPIMPWETDRLDEWESKIPSERQGSVTANASIPDEPGIYIDRCGNVWRKWRDGIFTMLGDRDQQPDHYAPFVRMEPVHSSADSGRRVRVHTHPLGEPCPPSCAHSSQRMAGEPMTKPATPRHSDAEVPEWTELNEAALALYKVENPEYDLDTFEQVPRLATVTEYRHRAWIVIQAVERFRAAHGLSGPQS